MDIGKPKKVFTVEPIEDPVPREEPAKEPRKREAQPVEPLRREPVRR
jgi:hypothetical protein